MLKLLLHRVPRDIKVNWLKYLIMTLVVTFALFAIMSFLISYDSMEILTKKTATTNNVEDGEFGLLLAMSEDEKNAITDMGISIEEEFYFDEKTSNGETLRLYKVRENINTIELVKGKLPTENDEVLIEKLFASRQNIGIGDTVTINNTSYRVCGIGVTPDYNMVYREINITTSSSKDFGTAFLTSDAYESLKGLSDSIEIFNYAYTLNDSGLTDSEFKSYLIKNIDFDYHNVSDPYYQEMIMRNTKDQQALKNATEALAKSFESMETGLNLLNTLLADMQIFVDEMNGFSLDMKQKKEEFNSTVTLLNEKLESTTFTQEDVTSMIEMCETLKLDIEAINTDIENMVKSAEEHSDKANEMLENAKDLETNALIGANEAVNKLLYHEEEIVLTKDNYREILDEYIESETIQSVREQLIIIKSSVGSAINASKKIQSYIDALDKLKTLILGAQASADSFFMLGSESIDDLKADINNSDSETAKDDLESVESYFSMALGAIDSIDSAIKKINDNFEELSLSLEDSINMMILLGNQVQRLDEEFGYALDEAKNAILNDLGYFVAQKDNSRILSTYARAKIFSNVVRAVGIVICFILSYILSVFASQQIAQDTKNIGTLYSMGVTKTDLLFYYLTIPMGISFIGGILGLFASQLPIGILNTYRVMELSGASVCDYIPVVQPYVYIFCIIGPAFISFIVNVIVINGKLNKKPISLLNNSSDQIAGKDYKFIQKLSFTRAFQARQITREKKTGIMVGFGVFACILVLMLAININSFAHNAYTNTRKSINYEYLSIFKYAPEEVPDGAEAHFMMSLNVDSTKSNNSVSLIGTTNDSKYYPKNVVSKGLNKITICRTFANKYGYTVGSPVILTDSSANRDYIFYVDQICDYDVGLIAFMDEESMLELFSKPTGYYNMALSDEKIDCEAGRLYTTITKDEFLTYAGTFIKQIEPIAYTILVACYVIMVLIMFILLGVMIDRSKYGISLLKVMGYNQKEISRIYLDSNLFYILLSAIISVPIGRAISDRIVVMATKKLPAGIDLSVAWYWYIIVFAGTILAYISCTFLLQKRLGRITLAEALKSRG